ncbi:hypothetical protein E2C01_021201 [Portunus trituberculatus]|uniref:Uncharacterized protein n=1 Tax=Portunus trituberculatus TaxID=210409 RepID=A0A5B7E2M2_PORTR|nr:hypothetical protein [Portunus trituberculatus]
MKFRKGDNTYKELLERSVAHCRQSDKMASGEHTATFNEDQIEELCETFNTALSGVLSVCTGSYWGKFRAEALGEVVPFSI